MAIATILRRTASAAAPLVTRAVSRSQKYHHGSALLSAAVNRAGAGGLPRQALSRSLLPSAGRCYSSRPSSDESLLRIIDSEIKCAEECDDQKVVDNVPDGFPFKIEDTPGQQTISLTRKYQDETITVEVHMPDLVTGEDEDDDDDADDDEKSNQSNIPLVVKVSKKRGPCLEFTITAFPDEISIDNLSVKDPDSSEDEIAYEGPDFADLDENLQKAFHKYLEIRGIKPSTTNFLHEYMINKDSKEYLMWLKNVKAFIKA